MNDDLRRELEAAGRRDVPAPRPGFEAELEDRLAAIAREPAILPSPATAPSPASPSPVRPKPGFGFAAGLAGFAAVLAIVVVMSGFGLRSTLALELTEAVNVEVALADGTTLVDPEGLLLPDGAVIRIGSGGSARVGDVVLGAGDVATVTDRRLEVDPRDDATTTVIATPIPSRSPAGPTHAPVPRTPAPSERPSTPRPDASIPPKISPTPRIVSPAATVAGDPGPTPTSKIVVVAIKLEARRTGPSEVGVSWTAVQGAARYVLLATPSRGGSARDPVYPGAPVIGEFTHPPLKPQLFRVGPEVVEVRLLVVALSDDGATVGRSKIAIVELPRG